MVFRLLSIVVLLALAACATRPGGADREELDARAKASLESLVDCLYSRADAYAGGSGTPSEIADAASGDCERGFSDYERALADHYVSLVSQSGEHMARRRASNRVFGMREKARRAIISRVLRLRDGLDAQPNPL